MVAGIAAIDLPQNVWHEVIGVLVKNVEGTDQIFKVAALQTLEYICEELSKGNLTEPEVDAILSAVVGSLLTEGEVREIALNTLQKVIPFCEKNMKVDVERNILLTKIIENCKAEKEEVRVKGMKCLLEVARCFYDYIDIDGLELIVHITIEEIKKPNNDEVGVLAVEFWSTICDEEVARLKKPTTAASCKNYIQTASPILLQLLLESLTNTPADEDDTRDVSLSSACCISLMAEILKDNIIQKVLEYVQDSIQSDQWEKKKAGVLAFVSILKGPSKEKMNQFIIQILSVFLTLLRDEKQQLRESAAWAFSKIAEINCEVLASQQVFPHVIPMLLERLTDVPKVSNHICFAINSLAAEMKPSEIQTTSLMSPLFNQILDCLWKNAFRKDAFGESINLAYSSFVAFSNVIFNATPDCIPPLQTVFKTLIEQFSETIKGTFKIPAHIIDFQGYFCTAMHPIFMKLGPKIDSVTINTVVNLLIESFKLRGTVYDEGLQAFSGLILGVNKTFQPFAEKLGPYLVYSLKNIEDTILCRVAIGCVGDMARALEDGVTVYLKEFVPLLLDILRDPNGEYGLKPITISALGDLAFVSGKHFEPYLNDLLEILNSASELSLAPPEDVFLLSHHRTIQNYWTT